MGLLRQYLCIFFCANAAEMLRLGPCRGGRLRWRSTRKMLAMYRFHGRMLNGLQGIMPGEEIIKQVVIPQKNTALESGHASYVVVIISTMFMIIQRDIWNKRTRAAISIPLLFSFFE